jgi:hypothetical protein
VGVVLDFEEPLVEAFEGVSLGEVEDQEGCDGALVVRPGDGFEGFLARLPNVSLTVSQIWILIV